MFHSRWKEETVYKENNLVVAVTFRDFKKGNEHTFGNNLYILLCSFFKNIYSRF